MVQASQLRRTLSEMPDGSVARHHTGEDQPGGRMGANGNAQRRVVPPSLAPGAVLEAIIEMSDDAIFTCDLQGRITTWGATAERLFGREEQAVHGGLLEVLFPHHLSRDVRAVVATALAGDRVRHFESEVVPG